MAEAGRPINVQVEHLVEASTNVSAHLEASAKQPTAVAPHLTTAAAPVDAAARQAAAAMHLKIKQMSTELAAKGPATQQAATAAAANLQAQDIANSVRLPSVPSPSGAGADNSGTARSGTQMLGSGPPGTAPAPRAPSPAPQPPPQPAPQPPPQLPGPRPSQGPDPRLRHLPPPSWTRPAPAENSSAAQRQYQQITDDIRAHNSWRPNPSDEVAVTNYNREAQWLNESKRSLESQLNGWKAPYDPSPSPADDANAPMTGNSVPPPHTAKQPPAVRHETSGGPGHWNPDLQNLDANTEYIVDGKFHFWTDENGRVKFVQLDINDPISPGPRSGFDPPGLDPGDHRGHLVPRRFGGPGELINLTGQDPYVNLSTVKKIENEWWAIYQAQGSLNAEIEVVRDAAGRPLKYIYEWQNISGEWSEQEILNPR